MAEALYFFLTNHGDPTPRAFYFSSERRRSVDDPRQFNDFHDYHSILY